MPTGGRWDRPMRHLDCHPPPLVVPPYSRCCIVEHKKIQIFFLNWFSSWNSPNNLIRRTNVAMIAMVTRMKATCPLILCSSLMVSFYTLFCCKTCLLIYVLIIQYIVCTRGYIHYAQEVIWSKLFPLLLCNTVRNRYTLFMCTLSCIALKTLLPWRYFMSLSVSIKLQRFMNLYIDATKRLITLKSILTNFIRLFEWIEALNKSASVFGLNVLR